MTHDVFIRYASEDRATARSLADTLVAARGWSVWWDTHLRSGDQYPLRIQEAVATSRCVIVLWSRHSVQSDWVIAEASEGWSRKVLGFYRPLPMLHRGRHAPEPSARRRTPTRQQGSRRTAS